MIYCKNCLYPGNHPYGLVFNSEGVCSGCRVHQEKDQLDWESRFELLKQLVFENKGSSMGASFDCIVPVTGGGDSYFTVHVVKNLLGLNPLLVQYNSHYNTRIGVRNLANLATVFDCDVVSSTLSPTLLKRITRKTLRDFGSIYWQVLAGNLTFPVQVAVKFRIPLIVWGVHPWSDQTGMFSHLDEVEMTERCRKEHGLMGISAEDLVDESQGISRADVQPFVYPYDNELETIGVRGIYLSNFIRWDSKAQHELMIEEFGYETQLQQRTFNSYEDVHCFHSAGLHDYLKFLRLGYSKVTDHATREIRLGRLTRAEGASLVARYSDVKPNDTDVFLEWLGMEQQEFWSYVWDRRDPRIWTKDKHGCWRLSDHVGNHVTNAESSPENWAEQKGFQFKLTENVEADERSNQYLLMGRGYVDKFNYGAVVDRPVNGKFTKRRWVRPSIV